MVKTLLCNTKKNFRTNILLMFNSDKDRWTEIIAVSITGVLKFVFMDWLELRVFYITAAILFWVLFIYRQYRNTPNIQKYWGFQKLNFKQSFLLLLPFGLLFMACTVIYGFRHETAFLNWHIIPIFILYPLWGVIQQFVVIGLVAGNLKSLTTTKLTNWQIAFVVSLLFTIVHYNSIPLMIYVFVMEFVFIHVYFKWKNLWSLGLYHGWASSFFLFYVLERDLWNELLKIFL